jgi:hypothetical protein
MRLQLGWRLSPASAFAHLLSVAQALFEPRNMLPHPMCSVKRFFDQNPQKSDS